ncbi:hypothetical protein ZEAMMB73_Zm00001d045733 [Zea mays]|uniref:SDE2/SF3A3 SAP domain-containing protein n=1 Tax=Zea mays TaxID=4577 RepID=A0A1D6NYM6_MAIZE|nr:hypothetical protein ZEAMMB73_Zm00001d045733 [Zea mays]
MLLPAIFFLQPEKRHVYYKVHKCVSGGGKVLIPMFALGRAQNLKLQGNCKCSLLILLTGGITGQISWRVNSRNDGPMEKYLDGEIKVQKKALSAQGLKCGGTVQQRAYRLFLLKVLECYTDKCTPSY